MRYSTLDCSYQTSVKFLPLCFCVQSASIVLPYEIFLCFQVENTIKHNANENGIRTNYNSRLVLVCLLDQQMSLLS